MSPPDKRNPAVQGGASRDLLGGWSQDNLTPIALQSQFLIDRNVRPELAATLAAFAFDGGAHV